MSGLDHRHTVAYLLSVFLVLDILAPGLSTMGVFLPRFGYSSDFSSWTYVDMNGDDVYDGATKLWSWAYIDEAESGRREACSEKPKRGLMELFWTAFTLPGSAETAEVDLLPCLIPHPICNF